LARIYISDITLSVWPIHLYTDTFVSEKFLTVNIRAGAVNFRPVQSSILKRCIALHCSASCFAASGGACNR